MMVLSMFSVIVFHLGDPHFFSLVSRMRWELKAKMSTFYCHSLLSITEADLTLLLCSWVPDSSYLPILVLTNTLADRMSSLLFIRSNYFNLMVVRTQLLNLFFCANRIIGKLHPLCYALLYQISHLMIHHVTFSHL